MISQLTALECRVRAAHPLLNIAVMNKLLVLALSVPLVACVIGDADSTGAGTGDDTGHEPGNGSAPTDLYQHITASTTWTGSFDVTKNTKIDPGVTVTVAPGTVVKLASQTSLTIAGVLDVQGSKAAPVQIQSAVDGQYHYGVSVGLGGELKMTYGVQTGGGITVDGGKATVTDSRMSHSSGDFLVIDAGTLVVSYSSIGLEPGVADTTHCDLHFGGTGTTIKINHTNISTSTYGLMLYGGNGVDLTSNNWFSNTTQVDTQAGASGDLSNGWFDKGLPTAGAGATLTINTPAATRLLDAGPR